MYSYFIELAVLRAASLHKYNILIVESSSQAVKSQRTTQQTRTPYCQQTEEFSPAWESE
jgi:hypothetical protein